MQVLFNENYDKIYRVAYNHLHDIGRSSIEDVIQETFRRACENFRGLSDYDLPSAWLVQTAHHVALDEVKRYRRMTGLGEESLPDEQQHDPGLNHILPGGIAETDREILSRYYANHDTSAEIASDLDMTPTAVRQRLCRLRSYLKRNSNFKDCHTLTFFFH